MRGAMQGRRLAVAAGCLAALLAASGCERDPIVFDPEAEVRREERAEAAEEIDRLAAYERAHRDPDAEAAYHDAVRALTARGARIEDQLLEALIDDRRWGVRYGVINVLDSVGTHAAVPHLIDTLLDPHPEVAYKALFTLRVLTDHREIPEEGVGESGLPAVPRPSPEAIAERELAQDEAQFDEWTRWHARHGIRLHELWVAWWGANEDAVTVR